MLRVDPQIMAWSPLWIAAASAALLVVVMCALALRPSPKGLAAAGARVLLILLGATLSGSLTWTFLAGATLRDQDAERSVLELRAAQLMTQSLLPGSPLACLDALAGDTVQVACERAVFASPANVAAAISYVAAQFVLLSDMTDFAKRGGRRIDDALRPLQRALQADPFGFLAHVLVMRDGCTSENCPPLALLADPSHVRTNIIAQTLRHYVDHYRDVWARSADGPVAEATDTMPTAGSGEKPKVSVNIDFPSAASIPPISIMNPEPKRDAAVEPAHKHESAAQADPVWTPAPAPAAQ
jgi:hypothetical protein